jgi:2,4-dienoyl-CoA reductase (NADPH2)
VTLIEKETRLGGQLLAAAKVKEKSEEIGALIRYYETMLKKHGVELRLGTGIAELPDLKLEPEVVVLAIGAEPWLPQIPGSADVVSAYDLLMGRGKAPGKNVVVIGASGVGIDTALYLTEKAERQVTVVEMKEELGGDLNEFLKHHAMVLAKERGIKFLTNWKATGIVAGKLQGQTLSGFQELECDTVVGACGYRARASRQLREAFEKAGVEVHVIGSAFEAGRIFEATQGGFWIGAEI